MLKLIIADDERVMRETIHNLIEWEKLGISVAGLCEDGIEAFNMILDEEPDIVMTDIRMPGLSGLDLVREAKQMELQTQFIILSGYEEFEYAREAMKYGVQHYLLKPCDEDQIMESIRKVSEECYKARRLRKEKEQMATMMRAIRQNAMYHLIVEGILLEKDMEFECLAEQYGQYFDFTHNTYELKYLYYLEQDKAQDFLRQFHDSSEKLEIGDIIYGLYVKNTLLLFCQEQSWKAVFEGILNEVIIRDSIMESVLIEKEVYPDLIQLLKKVINKAKRFDTVYSVHDFRLIPILNSQNVMAELKEVFRHFEKSGSQDITYLKDELLIIVKNNSDAETLKLLASGLSIHFANMNVVSPAETAEFMKKVNQTAEEENLQRLSEDLIYEAEGKLSRTTQGYGTVVAEIMDYVKNHMADPDLTLKNIAETYLYMNVDYVSRKFQKETGTKFSQYLMEARVNRAKELLMNEETGKILYVAEAVGCSNNPRYFTQIFKKVTGLTPSKWAEQIQSSTK